MNPKKGKETRDRKITFKTMTVPRSEMVNVKGSRGENTEQVLRLLYTAITLTGEEVKKVECQNPIEAQILFNRCSWQIKHKGIKAGVSRYEKFVYVYPAEK